MLTRTTPSKYVCSITLAAIYPPIHALSGRSTFLGVDHPKLSFYPHVRFYKTKHHARLVNLALPTLWNAYLHRCRKPMILHSQTPFTSPPVHGGIRIARLSCEIALEEGYEIE